VLRRIDVEDAARSREVPAAAPRETDPIAPVALSDLETTTLPHDHPRWVRDAVAVSQRARRLLETLRPVVIAVLSLWDHRRRCIVIEDRRVRVDPSGSYRVDV